MKTSWHLKQTQKRRWNLRSLWFVHCEFTTQMTSWRHCHLRWSCITAFLRSLARFWWCALESIPSARNSVSTAKAPDWWPIKRYKHMGPSKIKKSSKVLDPCIEDKNEIHLVYPSPVWSMAQHKYCKVFPKQSSLPCEHAFNSSISVHLAVCLYKQPFRAYLQLLGRLMKTRNQHIRSRGPTRTLKRCKRCNDSMSFIDLEPCSRKSRDLAAFRK